VEAGDGAYTVVHDGETYVVRTGWRLGHPLFHGEINGTPVCFQVERRNVAYRINHRGSQVDAMVLAPRAAQLGRHMLDKQPPDLSRFLLSPMPGLLIRLAVKEGDEVKEGEELAVVEAMKMENVLNAARDCVVKAVLAEQGAHLAVDQAILEFE